MGSYRFLVGAAVLAAATVPFVMMACGDTEPPDVPAYGPPNGIPSSGPNPPPMTGSSGSSYGGSSGGSSGSGSGGSGSGGTAGPQFACQTAGETLVEAGACSVSWTNDIFPQVFAASAGISACTATVGGCHGLSQPPVMTGNASAVYTTLANSTSITGLSNVAAATPFINPCSTDPTKSSLYCSTQVTGGCGIAAMPPGTGVPDASAILTWVQCGAPLN